MKRATGYEAADGEWFDTAEKCKAHERVIMLTLLEGLTEGQVAAAVDRSGRIEIADAIEFAGNLIAEKRRADGHLKRNAKTKGTSA